MKKYLMMLMTVIMVFCFAACGSGEDQNPSDAGGDGKNTAEPGGDGKNTAEPSGNQEKIADALALLNAVWDSYGEDDKFPAAGGDFSEENMVMNAPGKYGIGDASALDASLGLPEASVSKIDGAASLVHMMNANTFTCGAFHVTKAEDVSGVAEALKNQILQRQWMCGFPDKLVVITVDDYVVSAFGNEELINTFKTRVTEVYKSATLAYEESIF